MQVFQALINNILWEIMNKFFFFFVVYLDDILIFSHDLKGTCSARFSKAAHFVPLSKLPSASETANLPVQHAI